MSSNGMFIFKNDQGEEFIQVGPSIGSGGFGQVYKMSDQSGKLMYAVKKIRFTDEGNTESMAKDNINKIKREVEIMRQLNCEHVVKYYDNWQDDQHLYIRMELCKSNLKDRMENKGKYFDRSPGQPIKILEYMVSVSILRDLAHAVKYLHDKSIIHRDLKPGNVLIGDGQDGVFIKLCDFGLAVFHDESYHTSRQGTKAYMAPEIKDGKFYNKSCDVFSLALIGLELSAFDQDIKERNRSEWMDRFKELRKQDQAQLITYANLVNFLEMCITVDPKRYHDRSSISNFLEFFDNIIEFVNKFTKNNIQATDLWKRSYFEASNDFETCPPEITKISEELMLHDYTLHQIICMLFENYRKEIMVYYNLASTTDELNFHHDNLLVSTRSQFKSIEIEQQAKNVQSKIGTKSFFKLNLIKQDKLSSKEVATDKLNKMMMNEYREIRKRKGKQIESIMNKIEELNKEYVEVTRRLVKRKYSVEKDDQYNKSNVKIYLNFMEKHLQNVHAGDTLTTKFMKLLEQSFNEKLEQVTKMINKFGSAEHYRTQLRYDIFRHYEYSPTGNTTIEEMFKNNYRTEDPLLFFQQGASTSKSSGATDTILSDQGENYHAAIIKNLVSVLLRKYTIELNKMIRSGASMEELDDKFEQIIKSLVNKIKSLFGGENMQELIDPLVAHMSDAYNINYNTWLTLVQQRPDFQQQEFCRICYCIADCLGCGKCDCYHATFSDIPCTSGNNSSTE